MGKYIDWYIVELERMLKGSVQPDELASSLSEVEAHLTELSENLAPLCKHAEEPEKIAIERFGLPEKVAMSLVMAKGQVAYWPIGIVVAISVATSFTLKVVFQFSSLSTVISGFFLSVAAVILFVAYGSIKTRRVLVAAITIGSASAYLFFTASDAFTYGCSRSAIEAAQLRNSIKEHPIIEEKLKNDLAWIDQGIEKYKSGQADKSSKQQDEKLQIGKYPAIVSTYDPEASRLIANTEYSQIPFMRLDHVNVDSGIASKWWRNEAPQYRMNILRAMDNMNLDFNRTVAEYRRPYPQAFLVHSFDYMVEFMSYTLGLIFVSSISLKIFTSERRKKLVRKSIA